MIKIFKNIFLIITPSEKRKMFRLILLDIGISILDIAFLALLLWVIQFYTDPSYRFSFSLLPALLFKTSPLLVLLLFFFFFSVKNYWGYRVYRMQLQFVYRVASRLSKDSIIQYLGGPFTDYLHIDSSVHTRSVSQQPVEFSHYVLRGVQLVTGQSVLILITIGAILCYNPVLFPLLLVILTPPVILAGFLMKRKLNGIRKTAKPAGERSIQYLKEALAGFVESNLYEARSFFARRYYQLQSQFNHFLSEQQVVQNMPSRMIEIFAVLGLFVLIAIHSLMGQSGPVKVITLGAFMAAAYKIIPGVVKVLNSLGQIKTYEFTITDLLNKKTFPEIINPRGQGELRSFSFENVSFNFSRNSVLKNFSFNLSKGDFIGLSGISARGKTTVINLLLGFLEPTSGVIFLNETASNAAQRRQFWSRIAYVKQQPLLIGDTLLKNITLEDQVTDYQQLEEVIRVTGLKEWMSDGMGGGLNKMVTEHGKNLSGGQRQRLMLARALYKKSDLIILDEPFSELDRVAENGLLLYLADLALAGKMILFISHHKESLSFCNKMISLDEKRPTCIGDINPGLS